MTPLFHLQIVSANTGEVITFPAGGPLEREFIQACAKEINARTQDLFPPGGVREQEFVDKFREALNAQSVGWWRSQAAVVELAGATLSAVLRREPIGLTHTEGRVHQAMAEGIAAAIMHLKADTRFVVR